MKLMAVIFANFFRTNHTAMLQNPDLFAAFQAYDKNGDGTLTADELMGILLNPRTGTPMTLSDAEEFVAYADTNGEREGSGGP